MVSFPVVDQLLIDAEHRSRGLLNHFRNAEVLGNCLSVIRRFDEDSYQRFASRLSKERDENNYHGCFAEIITSAHLVHQVHCGWLKAVRWSEREADVIATHRDGQETFLEVLSVRPEIKVDGQVHKLTTHAQDSVSSIRGKIVRKLEEQGQFPAGRRNVAVVELNHYLIAGDFAVQSSLSDGYQVILDEKSGRAIGEGFDWSAGGFLATDLGRRVSGVIDFDLGYYAGRRHVINPNAGVVIAPKEFDLL